MPNHKKPKFTTKPLPTPPPAIKSIPSPPSSEPKDSNLKIIPLGGLEEVGKNMTVFEYGNDIIIIDMGLMFPNEEMLGIDYVIPDISYLVKNKHKIRGIIFTHGHLDHIGAVPYLLEKLGNPYLYGTPLTIELIRDRLAEFGMDRKARLNIFTVNDNIRIGNFELEFFRVNHNIPDGVGIAIYTPVGLCVTTGDFKFDYTPVDEKPSDFSRIALLGGRGVLVAMCDSTSAEKEGHSISEKKIGRTLHRIFETAKGRIIMATFSTLISRIQQAVNSAYQTGRKVAFSGMSLEKAVEITVRLNYLKIPPDTVISLKQTKSLPDNKVVIVATGSQGQESSALARMSRQEHREIKIHKGDTIILSSSPIPGNERSIYNMMDNLFRLGARVFYEKIMDIHTGGHAHKEDMKLMLSLLKPKYFVPIHGEHHMLVNNAWIARELGIPSGNIFIMENGQILNVDQEQKGLILKDKVPSGYVLVDGLGVGDVGHVVLRDRQQMAKDGMFVVIITVNKDNGALIGEPDIVSRGFIYMKESDKLLKEVKNQIKKIVDIKGKKDLSVNEAYIKSRIREEIGEYLFKRTERRPMILPVIIGA
ncbi:MAG: ribonuclease J [Candidatus Doudnabacteria bacterium]